MFLQNKWWVIAASRDICDRPVGIRRLGKNLVLWRDEKGKPICQSRQCPHRGVDLSLGRVVENSLECPYHGFRFVPDGSCVLMPCEGKDAPIGDSMRVKHYRVREAHDLIWLWYGEEQGEYPQIPWFDELRDLPNSWAEGSRIWDVHFTRVAEFALIDMHHFPFAHRKLAQLTLTAAATRFDPLETNVEGDIIHTQATLRTEDSSKYFPFNIKLFFPNMSLFDLPFKRLWMTITPIDVENTWVHFRYYVRSGFPWLDRLFAKFWLWNEQNNVQPDDYRLARSSQPQISSLTANNFVASDKTIVLWHKLYEKQMQLQKQKALEEN